MIHNKLVSELGALLYWTMLAACTVGPGTVVTCARAGAEYGYSLTWALIFASGLAFTLQEGTARLTITSGKSLGQCLKIKYQNGATIYNVALICWIVSACVCVGNTLLQANCWAGGLDAVLALPGADDLEGGSEIALRVGTCVAYAIVVLALLWFDKTEKLGVFLGIIMMGMVTLFLIVVIKMGISLEKFAWGVIPSLPDKVETAAEPTDIILSLVGTTSLGFNLFLGGAMAKGRKIKSAQRGIAFSTCAAMVVSELILLVGAGANEREQTVSKFTIHKLSEFIKQFVGSTGVIVFALGFIAASLSSQLTMPLGATVLIESVWFTRDRKDEEKAEGKVVAELKVKEKSGGANVEMEDPVQLERKNTIMKRSVNFLMVIIATVVISTNVDRLVVILIAQVFNGCLLPFFSICLLLCINDEQFMGKNPQKGWNNIFLVIGVTITLLLASNVIVQKVLSTVLTEVSYRLLLALCMALVAITTLCISTSLGGSLLKSWGCTSCCRDAPSPAEPSVQLVEESYKNKVFEEEMEAQSGKQIGSEVSSEHSTEVRPGKQESPTNHLVGSPSKHQVEVAREGQPVVGEVS